MQEIKVSIVVPVCNVENYLEECLDSILKQTLQEIEIICVNDGSKDNSLAILKKYEAKDKRIIVISKDNSGYGNTMNVGMDKATGKYIGIVESDDYIEPNMFERLYSTAEKYQAEIVKSDHYIFNTKDKIHTIQYICPEQYYNKVLNVDVCSEIYDFVMMNWTGIYRRDFICNHNIRHNETPGASFQDNGFWFQAISSAKRIVFINEAFYHYRQDNPNSSINSKAKVYCICEEYSFIQNFIISNEEMRELHFNNFFIKKVFNYLHSYRRIAEEYKLEFLEHIAKEFEEDLKLPYLKLENLDPWLLETVNRIIDSPKMYHIIDAQYNLHKEYEEVHTKLNELRNSKEFNKGLTIRKMIKRK